MLAIYLISLQINLFYFYWYFYYKELAIDKLLKSINTMLAIYLISLQINLFYFYWYFYYKELAIDKLLKSINIRPVSTTYLFTSSSQFNLISGLNISINLSIEEHKRDFLTWQVI